MDNDFFATDQTDAAPTPRPFRVVHSADWHLGKSLGDLSRQEEHRRFLNFLLQTIKEERADLLVIAGDIFDSSNPPQFAQRQYFRFLSELRRLTKCRVLVIAGNHDSPSGLDASKELLRSLHIDVIGAAPAEAREMVFVYPNRKKPALAVAAVPFLRDRDLRSGDAGESRADIRRALTDGIERRYAEVAEAVEVATSGQAGVAAIATGHLTVQGATASESERDIHIGGLGAVAADLFPNVFQYVALGHLHRPQAPGDSDRVRYSGSPIPLSFSEATDHKEVRVLDFAGGQMAANRSVPIPLARALVQLTTKREEIAETIAGFTPPDSPLPPWVELVVDGPLLGEDAFAIAAEAAAGRGFEIVRVLVNGGDLPASLRSGDGAKVGDELTDEDLLADPAQVFARRLDAEESLAGEEREALELAFQTLLERHHQGEVSP